MKLKTLLKDVDFTEVRAGRDLEITGITADSRCVFPGNLFLARKGERFDGAKFIGDAILAGASAILTDTYDPLVQVTQIICQNPGGWEAKIAARYYGRPSDELFVVGVTGTKGKTTSTYLVRHLLQGLGESCGLSGTIEKSCGEMRIDSHFATSDAISNQKFLREAIQWGCQSVVLEVSSHGLDQARVDEIDFDMALFTNLHADHLDYHKTIESYAAAKAQLFARLQGVAIVNSDSPWASWMKGGGRRITFGIQNEADIRAENIRLTPQGIFFTVQSVPFSSPLLGHFNVYNLLGAISAGVAKGAALSQISQILASFQSVPGRLEPVPNRHNLRVFIDYAHTAESMAFVLQTVSQIGADRIILVFGAGGNRDPARRTGMARSAEKGAHLSIVTTDNPRREDPAEISRQILSGFQNPEKVIIESDRKKAIEMAIEMARPQDIVLVVGKGHEKGQIFAHQTLPFSDMEVALAKLGSF